MPGPNEKHQRHMQRIPKKINLRLFPFPIVPRRSPVASGSSIIFFLNFHPETREQATEEFAVFVSK